MPELISDVAQAFALAAEAKGIVLSMDAKDRSAVAVGEVRLVERVLDNLLDNAIRFTPQGGTVIVACARAGDRVAVRVTDAGPGIAAEDRGRIFDRFYRGVSLPTPRRIRPGLDYRLQDVSSRFMAEH